MSRIKNKALCGLLFLLSLLFSCHEEERHISWSDRLPQQYFRVVTPSGLNLRSEPDLQSGIVMTLPFDTIGQVLSRTSSVEMIQGQRGIWLQTEANGKKGWIFSGFVITSTNLSDLNPVDLEIEPQRLPQIDVASLEGSSSVSRIDLPRFVLEEVAFPEWKPGAENGDINPCGKRSSQVVFRSKKSGRLFSWDGHSEHIVKVDYPLQGMVRTMGTACDCCCASGEDLFYAFEGDHVTVIRLHIRRAEKASCAYLHGPFGPNQPAVEARQSGKVLYTLVKVPVCNPTQEQNEILQKGGEFVVEDVRLFSSITFTRLEITPLGFKLIRRHVSSVPPEFKEEWDQAELLEQ